MNWWIRLGGAEARRHPMRTVLVTAFVAVPVFAMVVIASLVASVSETRAPGDGGVLVLGIPRGCDMAVGTPPGSSQSPPGGEGAQECSMDVARDVAAASAAEPGVVSASTGTSRLVYGVDDTATEVQGVPSVQLVEIDAATPVESIVGGVGVLRDGRWPAQAGEVVMTLGALSDLGVSVGDTWRSDVPAGEVTVVGRISLPNSVSRAIGVTGSIPMPPELVEGEPDWGLQPVPMVLTRHSATSDVAMAGAAQGYGLWDAPSDTSTAGPFGNFEVLGGAAREDVMQDGVAFVPLIGGAVMFWLGLVATTGLSIGARRRRRDMGLLLANGADPRQLRAASLGEGVVIGVVGAALGVIAGLGAASLGVPVLHDLMDTALSGIVIPWPIVAVSASLGLVAAVGAADASTRALRRQSAVELLRGASPTPRPAGQWLVAGVVAWAVFVAALINWYDEDHQGDSLSSEPIVMAVVGMIGAVGLVLVVVGLVRVLAGWCRALPVEWRLAGSDLTRHGSRIAAASAAVALTLAGAAGAASAVALDPYASELDDPDAPYIEGASMVDLDVLTIVDGQLAMEPRVDPSEVAAALETAGIDPILFEHLECTHGLCQLGGLYRVVAGDISTLGSEVADAYGAGRLVLPGYLASMLDDDGDGEVDAELAAGLGMVVESSRPSADPSSNEWVEEIGDDGGAIESVVHEAQVVEGTLTVEGRVLPFTLVESWSGHFALIGDAALAAAGPSIDGDGEASTVVLPSLTIGDAVATKAALEPLGISFYAPDPASEQRVLRLVMAIVAAVVAAVALLISGLALGMVRAESLGEDRTLAQVGVAPRRRRGVHAARGALTMLAAAAPAVVGVGIVVRVMVDEHPMLGVPLWAVFSIVVVLPALSWLLNLAIARPAAWDSR